MIRFIKKAMCISAVMLCISPCHSVPSSTVGATEQTDPYESVFIYANELSSKGCPKEATLEYKRYLFLQQYAAGNHITEAASFLAHYYYERNDLNTALDFQQQVTAAYSQSAVISQEQYGQSLQNEIALMQKILTSAQADTDTPDVHRNMSLVKLNAYAWNDDIPLKARYAACCAAMLIQSHHNEWSELQHSFVHACTAFPDLFSPQEKSSLRKYISAAMCFSPKNQMTAAWLSIFPGAGQLYAHDWQDALNAFLLNGTIIGLSTYSLINLNFIDFTAFELNPFIRFYRGNLYNAQKDTHLYNETSQAALCAPIDSLLTTHVPAFSCQNFSFPVL